MLDTLDGQMINPENPTVDRVGPIWGAIHTGQVGFLIKANLTQIKKGVTCI